MPAPRVTPWTQASPNRATMDDGAYVEASDYAFDKLPESCDEIDAVGQYIDGVGVELDAKLAQAGFSATSTSSVTIGLGAKAFTLLQDDLNYVPGSFVKARHDADNWMWGEVATIDGDEIEITVQEKAGAGTYDSWSFSLAEPIGFRPEPADGASVLAGTSQSEFVTPKSLVDAKAPIVATVTGTQSPDCSNDRVFQWTLSGNIILGPIAAGAKDGVAVFFRCKQPSSGGPRTLSRHASVKKGAELDLTLSTAADKVDVIAGMIVDGALEIYGITRDVG